MMLPAESPTIAGVTHRFVEVNGLRLHLAEAGSGPPVVLLHGFPEFWYSWRHQLPALSAAGFHVVAPDMRGYNLSDKPPALRDYHTRAIVADIADLIQRYLGGSARVVGHDWGGVIAWRLAQLHPNRVRQLAILNGPHPAAYRRELRRNFGQWLRSWYVVFFQIPRLPERLFQARDFRSLAQAFRAYPQAFSPEDVAHYMKALARPGALTATLNYYRAAVRYFGDLTGPPQRVLAPTLLIWGKRDPHLSERLADGLGRWVPNLTRVKLNQVAHWVQNEAPARVNQLLIEFLTQ